MGTVAERRHRWKKITFFVSKCAVSNSMASCPGEKVPFPSGLLNQKSFQLERFDNSNSKWMNICSWNFRAGIRPYSRKILIDFELNYIVPCMNYRTENISSYKLWLSLESFCEWLRVAFMP